MKKNLLIAFFALLFAPLFSMAQGLGSIAGRITDPSLSKTLASLARPRPTRMDCT
jgi:hypothetical protein